LIVAAPREAIESLVRAYGIIQDVIAENNLAITLDRISLIPDNDAKLENLQALAKSDAHDILEVSAGRTEIAGRVLDDIHIYKNEALRYEGGITTALRRIADRHAIKTVYHNVVLPRGLEADALLDDGEKLVLIEIKSMARPVSVEVVLLTEGKLHSVARYLSKPAAAIIVSRSGFTDNAVDAASRDPRIRLVQWVGPEDDEKLGRALTEIRTGP